MLLVAPGVTLLLLLANRAILKAPQAGEQHIHQVVLKPAKLVRDEGDDVQIPVGPGVESHCSMDLNTASAKELDRLFDARIFGPLFVKSGVISDLISFSDN